MGDEVEAVDEDETDREAIAAEAVTEEALAAALRSSPAARFVLLALMLTLLIELFLDC